MRDGLKVTIRHMEPSPAAREEIARRADKLFEIAPRLGRCEVVLEAPHHHSRHGEAFHVRIELSMPGGELVIDNEPDLDAYASIRRSFEAAERRLATFLGRRDRSAHG
jgi:ribosome-associated translation inhibitor RaiA